MLENISLRFRYRLRKGDWPSLLRQLRTSSNALCSVANQIKDMCGYDGDWNALDKFLDGRTELLGYGVACICDLATNGNQNVRTAFDQA